MCILSILKPGIGKPALYRHLCSGLSGKHYARHSEGQMDESEAELRERWSQHGTLRSQEVRYLIQGSGKASWRKIQISRGKTGSQNSESVSPLLPP